MLQFILQNSLPNPAQHLPTFHRIYSDAFAAAVDSKASKRENTQSTPDLHRQSSVALAQAGVEDDATRNALAIIIVDDLKFALLEKAMNLDFGKLGAAHPQIRSIKRESELHAKIIDEFARLLGCLFVMEQVKSPKLVHFWPRHLTLCSHFGPYLSENDRRAIFAVTEQYMRKYFVMLTQIHATPAYRLPQDGTAIVHFRAPYPCSPDDQDYLWTCVKDFWIGSAEQQKQVIARLEPLIQQGRQLGIPTYNSLFVDLPMFVASAARDKCAGLITWARQYEAILDELVQTARIVPNMLPRYNIRLSSMLADVKDVTFGAQEAFISRPRMDQLVACNGNALGLPDALIEVLERAVDKSGQGPTVCSNLRTQIASLKLYSKMHSIVCYAACGSVAKNEALAAARRVLQQSIKQCWSQVQHMGFSPEASAKLGKLIDDSLDVSALMAAKRLIILPEYDLAKDTSVSRLVKRQGLLTRIYFDLVMSDPNDGDYKFLATIHFYFSQLYFTLVEHGLADSKTVFYYHHTMLHLTEAASLMQKE